MKNVLFHQTFPVILIGLAMFLFVSCNDALLSETGIVTITLEVEPMIIELDAGRPEATYYIYMDDVYQGIMTGSGALTLEEISTGIHTFEASDYMMVGISADRRSSTNLEEDLAGKLNGFTCYGSIIYEVKPEVNYVTIPVTCHFINGMINGVK